jgi:hypothetical protein
MDEIDEPTSSATSSAVPTHAPVPEAPIRDRVLDLVALLILITLATGVFMLAGPEAYTAVTCGGRGRCAAGRGRPPRL